MSATLRAGPTILANKPGERKLTAIRQKAYQPARSSNVPMRQKEYGGKTKQRPTLVDIQNQTSRIPVHGGVNKAKIAPNEDDVCTRNRKGAPEVVEKALATTNHQKTVDATQARAGYHQRQKTTMRVMAPAANTIPAGIPDMDAKDGDDPYMCREYVRDICNNLLALEQDACYTIREGFMDYQSEVHPRHRAVLIDWLMQVHRKFGLLQETLFICIDTIDRYLQVSQKQAFLYKPQSKPFLQVSVSNNTSPAQLV